MGLRFTSSSAQGFMVTALCPKGKSRESDSGALIVRLRPTSFHSQPNSFTFCPNYLFELLDGRNILLFSMPRSSVLVRGFSAQPGEICHPKKEITAIKLPAHKSREPVNRLLTGHRTPRLSIECPQAHGPYDKHVSEPRHHTSVKVSFIVSSIGCQASPASPPFTISTHCALLRPPQISTSTSHSPSIAFDTLRASAFIGN